MAATRPTSEFNDCGGFCVAIHEWVTLCPLIAVAQPKESYFEQGNNMTESRATLSVALSVALSVVTIYLEDWSIFL